MGEHFVERGGDDLLLEIQRTWSSVRTGSHADRYASLLELVGFEGGGFYPSLHFGHRYAGAGNMTRQMEFYLEDLRAAQRAEEPVHYAGEQLLFC